MSRANRCDDTFWLINASLSCFFWKEKVTQKLFGLPARLWPVFQLSLHIYRSGHGVIPLPYRINHYFSLLLHFRLLLQHTLLYSTTGCLIKIKKKLERVFAFILWVQKHSCGWPWNWHPMLQVHTLAAVEHLEKKGVWLSSAPEQCLMFPWLCQLQLNRAEW